MMILQFVICISFVLGFSSCNEVYNEGIISNGQSSKLPLKEDDPHCSHHIHKFYHQMKCEPLYSPGEKCPTSYKCATLENRNPDLCYYGGKSYPVGFNLTSEVADFPTPCLKGCQCVRMYEGTRFYCSHDPPKAESCPAPKGCRHFYFMDDFACCQKGVISCNRGKPDSIKCMYDGRSYSEGERFLTTDDITCTHCVCASGFNGTVASPYCQQLSCVLELWGDTPIMLTRGCIPIYFTDNGCCPAAFRCPKPTDRVIKPEKKATLLSKTDKKCRFGNLTMEVGEQLSPWVDINSTEVECTCKVPPIPSCVTRKFNLTEEIRRSFAREGFSDDKY